MESFSCRDRQAALAVLRDWLRPGDAVLVKASRAAALEWVVGSLEAGFAEWTAGTEAPGGARHSGEEVR